MTGCNGQDIANMTCTSKGVIYFGAKGTNPENYGCRLKADGLSRLLSAIFQRFTTSLRRMETILAM